MDKLYSLQNGTDIRGVAYKDDKSDLEITLTREDVKNLVRGFATWIIDKDKKDHIKISIGTDSRLTGPDFRQACVEALTEIGVDVVDCGMATTPAMFMSTIIDGYKCDGAIMFTASHMPYVYNGLKMFTSQGCLEKTDLKDLIDICVAGNFVDGNSRGNLIEKDLIEDYAQILVDKIRAGVDSPENYEKPLAGMKIIVDAGNGAGGFFADKVLARLGADTQGSQFLNPDGMFPNHIPNPENKEAMASICQATLDNKGNLGIIFDTDVDRAAIVGSDGRPINKNALIALISSIILEEHPQTTIVTDSVTSNGLAKFITARGGIHHRFKRGYKNVINEAIRLNEEGRESHLAIETSGHAAIKENYFLDDGAYLISKILVKAAKLYRKSQDIGQLISDLDEALEDKEIRLKIEDKDFRAYSNKLIKTLSEKIKEIDGWTQVADNYEGIRVDCRDEKGWFLMRSSLHEPLLVINFESNIEGGCDTINEKLSALIR
ncbi:phosphomannomutase/phosphoglucomutase [Peptostreptococcus stomatis]|uniref:phosphomannomutase/phosphoglucomutase n=1 Tax=Peptostreptococcus stomatis TaxID=341694 RepID=UPI0028E3D5A0|nr:phosphomannomutase/phosphoglucomutase [Peptostreptococcus stomatis]